LETAIAQADEAAITFSIDRILLLHGFIMAFGGIPLIYYGDAIGTINDQTYLENEDKKNDSRWIHRPAMNWQQSELRKEKGTIEQRIFSGLKKMIATRKEITAFADHNNRTLISLENPHLFSFVRFDGSGNHPRVLVICNFDQTAQDLDIACLRKLGLLQHSNVKDLFTDQILDLSSSNISVAPLGMLWLET
jgi:amylosucrase